MPSNKGDRRLSPQATVLPVDSYMIQAYLLTPQSISLCYGLQLAFEAARSTIVFIDHV